jgi:hypothetical protein
MRQFGCTNVLQSLQVQSCIDCCSLSSLGKGVLCRCMNPTPRPNPVTHHHRHDMIILIMYTSKPWPLSMRSAAAIRQCESAHPRTCWKWLHTVLQGIQCTGCSTPCAKVLPEEFVIKANSALTASGQPYNVRRQQHALCTVLQETLASVLSDSRVAHAWQATLIQYAAKTSNAL